ncbi:MAG: prepilin peptidase [Clostridia bacterium]|nr:prepilin peptidase [Clostridia bacterium]
MKTVYDLIFVTALLFCGELDICFRRVPNEYVFLLLVCGTGTAATMSPERSACSLALFFLFAVAALASFRFLQGRLGGADLKIIAVVLLCLPAYVSVNVISQAFIMCGFFSVIYLASKKIALILRRRTAGPASPSACVPQAARGISADASAARAKKDPPRERPEILSKRSLPEGIPFVPFIAASACICLLF